MAHSGTAEQRLGLALSGGGHRAAFFHVGVLARLSELGLLRPVRVLSTVSGGSIVGALYYLLVKNLLATAGSREILARILRNLRGIYLEKRNLDKALQASERIIALAPQAAAEYRDRGQIYLELECFRAALADFRQYLLLKPDAGDAEEVQRKAMRLQELAARLN